MLPLLLLHKYFLLEKDSVSNNAKVLKEAHIGLLKSQTNLYKTFSHLLLLVSCRANRYGLIQSFQDLFPCAAHFIVFIVVGTNRPGNYLHGTTK